MNEAETPLADDELIRRIRDAFDQQATPSCPINEDWFRSRKQEVAAPTYPEFFRLSGRGERWMASLTVLAAVIGVAIVIFGSNVEHSEVGLTRDELVESIDSVAQQDDLDEQPAPRVNSEEAIEIAEEPLPLRSRGLLKVIQAANDFLARRESKPDLLIEQLHTHYALDRAALQSAFRATGVPVGITSLRNGVDKQRSWVLGRDQVAFTYGFAYPQIADDLTRLINACYGDEIVDDMLDGIRDDVDGPRVDFRNDFFPLLDGQVILVVSTRLAPGQVPLTVVLPVKDAATTWRLVNQAHRVEPDSSSATYGKVDMLVVARKEARATAWCIIENQLIIGDLKSVQATIDRWNGE